VIAGSSSWRPDISTVAQVRGILAPLATKRLAARGHDGEINVAAGCNVWLAGWVTMLGPPLALVTLTLAVKVAPNHVTPLRNIRQSVV